MNLYKVLVSLVEQTEENQKEDQKDVQTIQDFIENYSILNNIKNFSVSFGYSKLGLETETLETITLDDLKNIDELETEGASFEITNKNVMKILKYIKNKMTTEINKRVSVEGTILPFIIIISWNYVGSEYVLTSSYTNKKLMIYEYTINKSKHQVEKINRFISKRGVIKNSPFRLVGSILVYNDWAYNWDMNTFKKDIEQRRING